MQSSTLRLRQLLRGNRDFNEACAKYEPVALTCQPEKGSEEVCCSSRESGCSPHIVPFPGGHAEFGDQIAKGTLIKRHMLNSVTISVMGIYRFVVWESLILFRTERKTFLIRIRAFQDRLG